MSRGWIFAKNSWRAQGTVAKRLGEAARLLEEGGELPGAR